MKMLMLITKKNFVTTVKEEAEIVDSASFRIEFDTDHVVVGSKVNSKYTAIFEVRDKIAGDADP